MALVLVVDDEPTIALVIREVLSDEGFTVETAPDGLAALHRLNQAPRPDIVLIDLFMPGTSGRAVVEAMRHSESLQNVPIILVTGAAQRDEDFPPPGTYQAVITKPFDVTEVVHRVQDLMANV